MGNTSITTSNAGTAHSIPRQSIVLLTPNSINKRKTFHAIDCNILLAACTVSTYEDIKQANMKSRIITLSIETFNHVEFKSKQETAAERMKCTHTGITGKNQTAQ